MPKDSHDKFIAQKADIEILAVAITLLGRRASKNKSDPSQAIQVYVIQMYVVKGV